MNEPNFDENLWFTMGDCCSGRHYLFYNPHTFPGRMGAWCPVKKVGFCVSKSEVEDCSLEARYWIQGFLTGNIPDVPRDDEGEDVLKSDPRFEFWRENIKQFLVTGNWKWYVNEEPMPELSRFYGIIIRMYMEVGGQHHKAHFHAYYGDEVAIFSLSPIELIAGSLPRRQQRLVEAWAELHEAELMNDWDLLQEGQTPFPVSPL